MLFNEFALTTRHYLRTVTDIRPEWSVFLPSFLEREKLILRTSVPFIRLLEYAPMYYDLKTFPDGETKRALTRVQNKRLGIKPGRVDERRNNDERSKKKQKRV